MKERPIRELRVNRIESLIEDLKGNDIFSRERAIQTLSSLRTKKVVGHTIPLLRHKDTAVRMAAVEVLKNTGRLSIDEVLSLFTDESEDVRVYACEIAAHIKDERAIPYLMSALKNDTENVRAAACISLGEFKREDVVDSLIAALSDTEWVVFSAISSLGKIKDTRSVPHLLNVLKNGTELTAMAACEALASCDHRWTIEEVAKTVKGFEEKKRRTFLKVLVEKVDENLFTVLFENFKDDLFLPLKEAILMDKKRSREILGVLRYFPKGDSIDLIMELLNEIDEDHDDYEFLIGILTELKDVWAPHVEEYVNRGECYARHIIMASINASVNVDENILFRIFSQSSLELKREIVKHLDRLCTDGKKILSCAMRDKDGHIRAYAAEIAGKKMVLEMEDEIFRLVRNDYTDVRTKALKSLILLNREKAIKEIERLVLQGSLEDIKIYAACSSMLSAEENYPFVRRLIESEEIEKKSLAMHVVEGFIEDKKYIEFVEESLKQDTIPCEVLKIVKDKKLVQFRDRIVEIFGDRKRDIWTRYFAIMALSAFEDKKLFPIFVEAVRDKNPVIRIAGIRGLLSLKEKKALKYIIPLKEDKNEEVQMEARYAAEKLMGI